MADFTGTAADEIITPDFVSPTVTATGGARASNAADTINAGGGNDLIESGGGNDVVSGGQGNDTAILGSGNDTFVWNPGDGSDVVEGGRGTDTLVFNGANVNETMTLSANGSRTRLTRDVGNVTMDLNSMEHIDINARGGADNITVDDLTGTGVKQVAIDLSGTPGSGTGDGAADIVTVNGTAGDDHMTISNVGSGVVVKGLAAQVTVTGAEPADRLVINGLGGNDTLTFDGSGRGAQISVFADGTDVAVTESGSNVVTDLANIENLVINGTGGDDVIRASNGIAALTHLTINGGAGNDTIFGGDGGDLINAGDGNDIVTGGRGNDTALLGSGDDTFIWNPGDGSDVVEGQGGFDTMLFNGANVSEHIDISANGSRVRFTRDVANITMDLNSIERIDFNALGGADTITVDDLSGTGTKQVAIDLSATPGSGIGDGAADTVIVNGTAGNDHIRVASNGGSVVVSGLAAQVTINGAEAANDTLVINAQDGNDRIDASALQAGQINLVLNGGSGNDTLIGSAGNDMLFGGSGVDTFAFAGSFGHDTVGGFFAGSGNGVHDLVQFDRSIFSDFADVLQHAEQIGNDTTITVDPNRSVTLQNVTLNTLTAGDFRFV
jgi:Ca2+-binding RTX toxin-like protein